MTLESHTLIAVGEIRPALDNLRGDLGDLTSLRTSIREQGILQPLLLAPLDPALPGMDEDPGAAYVVVDGHRRFAAAVAEGLDLVPAMVRSLSDAGRVEAMLATALEKRDLLPTEEAEGYRRLVELGRPQREIAAMFGVSQPHISKTLKLASLPEQARKAVDAGPDAGGISRETALAVAGLPEGTQLKLYNGNRLPTAREIDDAVRAQKLSEKRSEAEAAARSGGLKVLRGEDVHYSMTAGGAKGVWLSYLQGEGRAGTNGDDHRAMPCHAVAWGQYSMQTVCTDPDIHPKAKPDPVKREARVRPNASLLETAEQKAAREAQLQLERDEEDAREKERAQAAESEVRRKAFTLVLVDNPKPLDVIALAAATLPDLYEVNAEEVLALLPALAELIQGGIEDEYEDSAPSDLVAEWVGTDHRRQLQVVYAISLVVAGNFAQLRPLRSLRSWDTRDGYESRLQAAYWAHLTAHGYEMSDLERSWLPAKAEAAGPVCEECGATLGETAPGEYVCTSSNCERAERDKPASLLIPPGAYYCWGWVGDKLHLDLRTDRENILLVLADHVAAPDCGPSTDRKTRIPALIAEHILGREPTKKEIASVSAFTNAPDQGMGAGVKVFRTSHAMASKVLGVAPRCETCGGPLDSAAIAAEHYICLDCDQRGPTGIIADGYPTVEEEEFDARVAAEDADHGPVVERDLVDLGYGGDPCGDDGAADEPVCQCCVEEPDGAVTHDHNRCEHPGCPDHDAEDQADEPEFTGDVLKRIGIGNAVTWFWECSCGARSAPTFTTEQDADDGWDTHMGEAHGLIAQPVDA